MDIKKFNNLKLPDTPGVYFFIKKREILYIGKATSLRDRVRSYFSNDLIKTRGMLLVDMIAQADTVRFQTTDSVLEAFILETELIKKHKPKYNTKEKDDKSFNYVVITKEDFPRVLVMRGRNIEMEKMQAENTHEYSHIFGPYPFGSELREALKLIRKIFPYRDTCTPLQGKPCFNATIGLCPGVCAGTMTKKEYQEQIKNIVLFFKGKVKKIQKDLEQKMHAYAKEHKFEEANEVKKTIYALTHINDISMIKTVGFNKPLSYNDAYAASLEKNADKASGSNESAIYRIEAYDIGHLSGKDMVGTMVVAESFTSLDSPSSHPEGDFSFNKNEYRKFNIKGQDTADDLRALREVLERRFTHIEWQMPNLIVIDGGMNQLKTARAVIAMPTISKYLRNANTQVVSIVKDSRHKAREILVDENTALPFELTKDVQKLLVRINAESHRFTVASHTIKRSISRGLNGSKRKVK